MKNYLSLGIALLLAGVVGQALSSTCYNATVALGSRYNQSTGFNVNANVTNVSQFGKDVPVPTGKNPVSFSYCGAAGDSAAVNYLGVGPYSTPYHEVANCTFTFTSDGVKLGKLDQYSQSTCNLAKSNGVWVLTVGS